MLKFQVRSSASSCSAESGCSSPSLSSIPSSVSSSHHRLSHLSTSSGGEEEQPPTVVERRRNRNKLLPKFVRHRSLRFRSSSSSPSPSLPNIPIAIPTGNGPQQAIESARHKVSEGAIVTGAWDGGRQQQEDPPPAECFHLRVYTGQIKPDIDYKTLRVSQWVTTEEVIRQLVQDKLRLTLLRDLNLFHLFMEVRTIRRSDGAEVRSILELDARARPLELQRCQPEGMSRFILGMDSNAILARIYDGEVCPESNYKSVFLSRRTSCSQVLAMLRQLCRLEEAANEPAGQGGPPAAHSAPHHGRRHHPARPLGLDSISELRLFVQASASTAAQIPPDCVLAGVYLSLLPGQRIVLRRVIVPSREDRNTNTATC